MRNKQVKTNVNYNQNTVKKQQAKPKDAEILQVPGPSNEETWCQPESSYDGSSDLIISPSKGNQIISWAIESIKKKYIHTNNIYDNNDVIRLFYNTHIFSDK